MFSKMIKKKMRPGEMAQSFRVYFSQRTQVPFPAIMVSSLQVSAIPAPGDLTPFSGLCGYLNSYLLSHTDTYAYTNN